MPRSSFIDSTSLLDPSLWLLCGAVVVLILGAMCVLDSFRNPNN